MNHRLLLGLLVSVLLQQSVLAQPHRDKKVRDDRENLSKNKAWYYDDLAAGLKSAGQTGRPLMVVLRCIP